VVVIDFPIFVLCVVCHAVDALISRPRCCAFLQFMFSHTQRARQVSSLLQCVPVVVSATIKTYFDRYVVFYVTYQSLYFQFVLQHLSASL